MTLKKTFVVAIADAAMMDNLDHIAREIHFYHPSEGDIRVVTHKHPEFQSGTSGMRTNFDVLVTTGDAVSQSGSRWQDILPANQVYVIKRPTKMEMGLNLWRWRNELDLIHFHAIPTHVSMDKESRQYSFGHDMAGKVVVKPLQGARGIGHFVVDTDKVSLETFLKDLKKVSYPSEAISISDNPPPTITIQELIAQYEPDVVFGAGKENYPGEGLQSMRGEGYVIQSLVDSVIAEYRVILDINSEPTLCIRRTRNDNTIARVTGAPYNQATGVLNKLSQFESTGNILDVLEHSDFSRDDFKAVGAEMLKIFKKLPGMSSVDLFLTAGSEATNNIPAFGIFEYCNQFGTAGIPIPISRKIHNKFAKDLVHHYLKLPE